MKEIVLIDGARTPFGTFGGALRDVSATDLGVHRGEGRARAVEGRPRSRSATSSSAT